MTRFLSGLFLFLFYCSAYAEIAVANVPAEQSNATGFILFSILFLALCVGFVWLVIWNDKKQKEKAKQQQE